MLVARINDDKPYRRLAVRRDCSAQGIPEQLRSQTPPLVRAVEGQTSKEDARDGIGAAAPGALGERILGDQMRSEGEVGHDDSFARVPYERATCVHCAGVEGVVP